jgi:hypothetical protein
MFKLIIILVLIIYLLNKVSVILFRVMGRPEPGPRKSTRGNINVDAAPPKTNKNGGIKGGEYVDYEEVK